MYIYKTKQNVSKNVASKLPRIYLLRRRLFLDLSTYQHMHVDETK